MTEVKVGDPMGSALLNFLKTGQEQGVDVYSKEVKRDKYFASYFLRPWDDMPNQERIALSRCKGKVLDVGAGGGMHSLWLQEKGFDVVALENSAGCADVMKKRGVKQVQKGDYFLHEGKYDTLLFLMNGTGLAGSLSDFDDFLLKAKSLLNDDGQILIDSSDIKHLFETEDGFEYDFSKYYYGEITFQMRYKKEYSPWFSWLYLDEKTFKEKAQENGLNFEVLFRDYSSAYLARLTF